MSHKKLSSLVATLSLFASIGFSPGQLSAQQSPQGPLGGTKPIDLNGRWMMQLPPACEEVMVRLINKLNKRQVNEKDLKDCICQNAPPHPRVSHDIEISQSGTKLTARVLDISPWSASKSLFAKGYHEIWVFEGEMDDNIYIDKSFFVLFSVGAIPLGKVKSDLEISDSLEVLYPPGKAYSQGKAYAIASELHSLGKNQPMVRMAPGVIVVSLCPSGRAIFVVSDWALMPLYSSWYRVSAAMKWRAADFTGLIGPPKK